MRAGAAWRRLGTDESETAGPSSVTSGRPSDPLSGTTCGERRWRENVRCGAGAGHLGANCRVLYLERTEYARKGLFSLFRSSAVSKIISVCGATYDSRQVATQGCKKAHESVKMIPEPSPSCEDVNSKTI